MDSGDPKPVPRIANAPIKPAPRALVIDDEPTIRLALRRFLTRLGWAVDEASSGKEAIASLLDSAHADRYRIVICDLRMPGVTGIELHDRVAERRPELLSRLIFSTGDIVSEEVASFIETTNCVVLQKPFELSALLRNVERIDMTKGDRPEARSG
jgi:CheY-like chemotaxis protein